MTSLPDKEVAQRVAQEILQICVNEQMDMLQIIGLFGLLTRGLINGAPSEIPEVPADHVEDEARAAFMEGLRAKVVLKITHVKGVH